MVPVPVCLHREEGALSRPLERAAAVGQEVELEGKLVAEEEAMIFKAGDAIVHPIRGAGVVERVVERHWRGSNGLYYRIDLLGEPGTKLMVPAGAAEALGLRLAIPRSKLNEVWHVLLATPVRLPTDHKKRYQLLDDKLHTGDVFQVAEVVRDMAWRRQRKGHLTTTGKRRYQEAIRTLAGEIAAVQDTGVENAEAQIQAKLLESLSSTTVA
jgi:CarD family transcriptional regulator